MSNPLHRPKHGVKTDGAFLPGNLQSDFLLKSTIGDSAFPELQTSVRRGTSTVYSAPGELPRQGAGKTAALATRVALATRAAPPNLGQKGNQSRLLCSKSCRAEVPAKPLHRPQESRWRPVQLLHWESSAP
ncbi:hypothetical protein P7K49_023125 [Saguinus oedipus]|uniref:Uncharacterized protein n=1 Tax=Saguinus oedipus TaxID=9490 RepID=A0ABQ9ULJ7_SAGOE|nr:hypothetical protein P7K49_023125 [Saguinus oedipus]